MSATTGDWKTAGLERPAAPIGTAIPWASAVHSGRDSQLGATLSSIPNMHDPNEKQALVIVDDDPDDRFLLERALRKAGVFCPIYAAGAARDTLAVLSQLDGCVESICLVLDVKLPDGSGFDLLTSIRAQPMRQRMKVVFLTGNRQPRLRMHAAKFRADGFLNKPNWDEDWTEVARALREVINVGQPEPA